MSLSVAMALSGLERKCFIGPLKQMYEQGANVVNNDFPKIRKKVKTYSVCSGDSGISSLSPDPDDNDYEEQEGEQEEEEQQNEKQPIGSMLKMYLDVIDRLEDLVVEKAPPKFISWFGAEELKTTKVTYEDRDILDLGSHIRGEWSFTTTKLPMGIIDNMYFENRSQYSRMANVLPPAHFTNDCEHCGFSEPIYF